MGQQVPQTPGDQGDPTSSTPDNDAAGTPPAGMDGGENNAQQPPQPSAEDLLAELDNTRTALKKANKEAETNRKELKKIQDAQTAADRAKMDEVERLKADNADLTGAAEARDALQAQVEALETAVTAQVDALMKTLKVPDYVKGLLEKMTPAEKLTYLAENQKFFIPATPPQKPEIDSQSGGGSPPKSPELDETRTKALRRRFRLG